MTKGASLITNESSEAIENLFYKPYGLTTTNTTTNEIRLYEGKEKTGSKEYYFGARYYNPTMRMFTQPDSMIPDVYDPQQLNIYAFERGNPYKYTDPTGNQNVDINQGQFSYGVINVMTTALLKDLRNGIDRGSISPEQRGLLNLYDTFVKPGVDLTYYADIESGSLPEDLRPTGEELTTAKQEAGYAALSYAIGFQGIAGATIPQSYSFIDQGFSLSTGDSFAESAVGAIDQTEITTPHTPSSQNKDYYINLDDLGKGGNNYVFL